MLHTAQQQNSSDKHLLDQKSSIKVEKDIKGAQETILLTVFLFLIQ